MGWFVFADFWVWGLLLVIWFVVIVVWWCGLLFIDARYGYCWLISCSGSLWCLLLLIVGFCCVGYEYCWLLLLMTACGWCVCYEVFYCCLVVICLLVVCGC